MVSTFQVPAGKGSGGMPWDTGDREGTWVKLHPRGDGALMGHATAVPQTSCCGAAGQRLSCCLSITLSTEAMSPMGCPQKPAEQSVGRRGRPIWARGGTLLAEDLGLGTSSAQQGCPCSGTAVQDPVPSLSLPCPHRRTPPLHPLCTLPQASCLSDLFLVSASQFTRTKQEARASSRSH